MKKSTHFANGPELPRVVATLPRYYPDESLLCVAVYGGAQRQWPGAKAGQSGTPDTHVLFLPYSGWQLHNQDRALRRTLAWWGRRR